MTKQGQNETEKSETNTFKESSGVEMFLNDQILQKEFANGINTGQKKFGQFI